ncbi:unnamed protein product [Owenia fusiformis]|uniref:Uncharacterized protein n=1 Tax=Owenia fusiformis TaxID=6347 RepID=A0A8J1YAI7_OWEFU|nr:unnamed protein product [Owenia fusiformis]
MFRKSGSASSVNSLLSRANAQLRGQKVAEGRQEAKVSDDDDDLQAYLTSLTKKTSGVTSNFEDLSDISMNDDDVVVEPKSRSNTSFSNKFMKKKPNSTENTPVKLNKSITDPDLKSNKPLVNKSGSVSSALNKVASFTSKYAKPKKLVNLSDSDLDMDISVDEDIMKEVQNEKKFINRKSKPPAKPTQSLKSQEFSKSASLQNKTQTNSFSKENSDTDDNQVRNKFLKKKPVSENTSKAPTAKSNGGFLKDMMGRQSVETPIMSDDSDEINNVQFNIGSSSEISEVEERNRFLKKPLKSAGKPIATSTPSKGKSGGIKLGSSLKYSTDVVLDSDDEDMAEYIAGLKSNTPSPEPRKTSLTKPNEARIKKAEKVTFRSKDDVRIQSALPSEESIPDSVSDDFGPVMNVMDLDSLEAASIPDTPSPVPTPSKRSHAQKNKPSPKMILEKDSTFNKHTKDKTKHKSNLKDNDIIKSKDKDKARDKSKEATTSLFYSMGLQSVDDLLGSVDSEKQIQSEMSDIQTVPSEVQSSYKYDSDFETDARTMTPMSIRSGARTQSRLSEIYTEDFESEPSGSKSPVSSVSDRTMTEVDETVSVTSSVTLPDTGSPRPGTKMSEYTDEFHSDISESVASNSDKHTSYSQSSYSSSSLSKSERTPPKKRKDEKETSKKKKAAKSRTVEVQTGADIALSYQWDPTQGQSAYMGDRYGLQYVDPTPIARQAVNADALEAMTSYNPAMLALNEMMREQLRLTQQFMQSQKYLHQSLAPSIDQSDYKYTTLEDTKQYIRRERKKRKKLTFEEALKMVQQEMDDRY